MSGPTSDSASQLRNDYRRLAALRAYEILDTPPDPMLDLLSRVTAELLDVPFACVSLVDEHRVFLKSAHGLSSGNLGPEPGLCVTAVETNQTRHIEQLLSDPLTADHPVVAGPPNVRSYAGTPLRTPDRLPIGTLCVMDLEPRSFTSEQLALLERLGGLVMDQIEATLATDPRKRRAADRYEAIASRLIVPPPIGVLVVDPDGGLMFVNDAARSMLNPTPGEGMAELLNRICEDDPAALLEVLGESDTSDTEATIQGRTADGELGPLSWQMERSNDGHSTNRIMVSVRPAVTEPEYVEAVLEAQKLESLGVLAGGVAHDLNNILGAIMGNTGLARDSLEDPNRLVRYLTTIDQATDRASALCEQLLVYAGGGQFSIRSTDLSQLIGAVSALLQATLPKKAVMNFGLSDALPSTDCDPEQLQHVLFNLVANASEALPEGVGSVSLSTGSIHLSTEELDRLVLGDGLSPGDFVWLEVADNGCGMEPDATRLIFDPFYTTKPHGHGLGMAAVLGIIRSHGGAISVKSTVGSGTTIRLYLPAGQRPATTPEPPEPAPTGRSECLTVLVVDDETGIRDALTDILSQNGHRVLSAADGVIGTQLIDAHPGEIDVAIIDLTMPNMDGSELYDEIRRRDDSMKVIFSSGYIQSASTRPITDAGLARFLKKPYRASALLAELEQFAAVPRSDSTNSSSAPHI